MLKAAAYNRFDVTEQQRFHTEIAESLDKKSPASQNIAVGISSLERKNVWFFKEKKGQLSNFTEKNQTQGKKESFQSFFG